MSSSGSRPGAAELREAAATSRRGKTGLVGDGQLTEAERQLSHAAGRGALVDLSGENERLNDPAQGAAWGSARTVRAQVLAELLTGQREPEAGTLRSVRLRGARIDGQLDLAFSVLRCPLLLENCYFEDDVDLRAAEATVLSLVGCHLPGLDATCLRTNGAVLLGFGFGATRGVTLAAAHIGGLLDLTGAKITNPNGCALSADGLVVEHSMFCRDGFTAEGEVRLHGAQIRGELDLHAGRLSNPGETALSANGLDVGQSMRATAGFSANGQVALNGARIGGDLVLIEASLLHPGGTALVGTQLTVERSMIFSQFRTQGEIMLGTAHIGGDLVFDSANLTNPEGEVALSAPQITIERDLRCSGLTAHGEVQIDGAHIGGNLQLRGANLTNPDGVALAADRISVEGAVACDSGFTAHGEVQLFHGHVGGTVHLEGATLTNPKGYALLADQLTVKQSMSCAGLLATGEVRLGGADLGGQLSLEGARLSNPDGWALVAQRITVDDVFCRDGFTAEGGVDLTAAQVRGVLDFDGAKLAGHGEVALNLYAARASRLELLPAEPPAGRVVLTEARVGSFLDDPMTWPDEFELDGFLYKTLSTGQTVNVATRLGWLNRHAGGYAGQPYEQLANVYRHVGDEEAARQVAIAKQKTRRSQLNPPGKAWNWLLYLTVGYGYRTWLAAVWLAVLTTIGSVAFEAAHPDRMVAASDSPPDFHSMGYTLDVLLPIADLGQQGAWAPQGALNYLSWLLIAAGWVLTTAVVAGVTGVLRQSR